MRTPFIAGNWKMHLSIADAVKLAEAISAKAKDMNNVDVVLCPSFTLLNSVCKAVDGTNVEVGGQNLYWESKGAYTGEISPDMLVDTGCKYVIIGHSERRQYFGETDASVRRRIMAAFGVGLTPIVCVGETLEEREEGSTQQVVERQISGALERFTKEDAEKIIIAYEPVWAIGTGKTATPETAQEVHAVIRAWLNEKFGEAVAEKIRILYGGSMKPDNANELLNQKDIDGGLIGGASLKSDDFNAIIDASR